MVVMTTTCVGKVEGYEKCPLKKRPLRLLNAHPDEDKKRESLEPENLSTRVDHTSGQENTSIFRVSGPPEPLYRSIDHILATPSKPVPRLPLCNDTYYDWGRTDANYPCYGNYSNPFLPYPTPSVTPFPRCPTEVLAPVGHAPPPVHRMSPYAPHSPSQTSPTFKASLAPSSSSAFHEYKPDTPSVPHQSHFFGRLSPIPLSGSEDEGSGIGRKREGPKHHCDVCQKSYCTAAGLSKHQQQHCVPQELKSFSCKHCDKLYTSLGALKMHIRTHTLPCKCHLCGKAFSRPWLLQGHIRTHTGEKPFSCPQCHRAFADRSNLRAHLQTHSEVKKYCCKSCGKTFSRLSLLVKHQESLCGSSGDQS